MQWQLVLAGAALGMLLFAAILMTRGHIAGPEKVIAGWSAARPMVPRRWLEIAFWGGMALAAVSCGIIISTASGRLSTRWNDLAQLPVWAALTLDAALAGRRAWFVISAAFLVFTVWQVALQFG